MNAFVRLVLPGFLLAGSLGAGPDPWTQLKLGLTPEAATALLGPPLLKSKGHGMETWIYDNGAEVLLRGNVSGWTLPTVAQLPLTAPVMAPQPAPMPPVRPPAAALPPKAPSLPKAEAIRLLGATGPTASPPP